MQHGNGHTETRTLDQAYQVVSVTVTGVTAADGAYGDLVFEYDANANRTAQIDSGQRDDYRINFSNNWLLETETADYRYDNAGNIVERGTDAFVYDSHHRLTEATVDGTTATYAYNVQHQRVSKSEGGTTTRFFYGQGGELLSERVVGTGLTAAEYVWLDGKPLAYIANGQVHIDHLGTQQVLTDASGTAAWEAEYRPFGETITTGNLNFPLRIPGQYHDAETGLHYNWHRYHDPATGGPLGNRVGGYVGSIRYRLTGRDIRKPGISRAPGNTVSSIIDGTSVGAGYLSGQHLRSKGPYLLEEFIEK